MRRLILFTVVPRLLVAAAAAAQCHGDVTRDEARRADVPAGWVR